MSPWIAATLGVIALMEGVAIAALLMRQPANGTPATATVAASPIPDGAARSTPPPAAPAVATEVPEQKPVVLAAAVDPIKAAASKQQSGGVQLVAPFELKVLPATLPPTWLASSGPADWVRVRIFQEDK